MEIFAGFESKFSMEFSAVIETADELTATPRKEDEFTVDCAIKSRRFKSFTVGLCAASLYQAEAFGLETASMSIRQ